MSQSPKVLLVWVPVTEATYLYLLQGAAARIALACHNSYLGCNDVPELQILYDLLENHPKFPDNTPINLARLDADYLVISGTVL